MLDKLRERFRQIINEAKYDGPNWQLSTEVRKPILKVLNDAGDIGEHGFFLVANKLGEVQKTIIWEPQNEDEQLYYDVQVQSSRVEVRNGLPILHIHSSASTEERMAILKELGEYIHLKDTSELILIEGHSHQNYQNREKDFHYSEGDTLVPDNINEWLKYLDIPLKVEYTALANICDGKPMMVINPISEMMNIARNGARVESKNNPSVQLLNLNR